MSLDEFIKNINETYPYWGVWASGATLIAGYVIAKMQENSLSKSPYQIQPPKQEITKEPYNKEYTKRTIKDAILPNVDSRISGVITEFHNSLRGYSGKIKDNTGQYPFYIDEDNIEYVEDQGLVPILLNDSFKSGTLIEMDVELNENIFSVNLLKHNMNNQEYIITKDGIQDEVNEDD